jgi:hypothetical protein
MGAKEKKQKPTLLSAASTLRFNRAIRELRNKIETRTVKTARKTWIETRLSLNGSRELKSFDVNVIISPSDPP